MKEQTCCLTGHRELPRDTDELVRRLTDAICGRIEAGVRHFGVGGAVGFDTLAAEVLLNLRDTLYPQIRVIAVEPFDGFTSRWTDAQRARRQTLLPRYDKRVCLLPRGSRKPIWPGTGTWWTTPPTASATAIALRAARPTPCGTRCAGGCMWRTWAA